MDKIKLEFNLDTILDKFKTLMRSGDANIFPGTDHQTGNQTISERAKNCKYHDSKQSKLVIKIDLGW